MANRQSLFAVRLSPACFIALDCGLRSRWTDPASLI